MCSTVTKAIIFDMDGVLVDTEQLWAKAEFELVGDKRVFSDEVRIQLAGGGMDYEVDFLKREFGLEGDHEELMRKIHSRVEELIESKAVLFDGVVDVLKHCKTKYSIGLATSSQRLLAERLLTRLGAIKYFDVMFFGDDVVDPKPAPEIYLKAAKALGVDPSDCVVVEDSVSGVISAKRAGMRCIGVSTTLPPESLVEAKVDVVIDSLKSLKKYI